MPGPIDLIPLCTVRVRLVPMRLDGTPAGTRIVAEAAETVVTGDRLSGTAVGPAADWMLIGPDGTGMLDARFTLRTHDGALVFVRFGGRTEVGKGIGAAPVVVAPRFETGDPRYAWLNTVQAIGKGTLDPAADTVEYDWYEVR